MPIGSGTIGGLIELDFFNLSDSGDNNFNNNQLRTRLLYMDLEFGIGASSRVRPGISCRL